MFSLFPLFQELRRAHVAAVPWNKRVGQSISQDAVYTISTASDSLGIAPSVSICRSHTRREASITSKMPWSRTHSSVITVLFSAVLVCGYAVLLRLSQEFR